MKTEGIFVTLLCAVSSFCFPAYAMQTGEYAPHAFGENSVLTDMLISEESVDGEKSVTVKGPMAPGGPNSAGGGRLMDLAREKKSPPKPGPNDGGGGGKLMDLAQEKRPPIKGPNDGGGGGTNPK